MPDNFTIGANKSNSNNKNYIGASDAYFDEAWITTLNTVTLNATGNTSTSDTIIELNNGESGANTNDLGITFERGSHTNAAFMWDETANRFTLVEAAITGASSGDLNLESATLATLRAKLTATSFTVEGGTSVTGSENAAVTLPKGSINIQALDILNGNDGSANITANDLFIMYDIKEGVEDTPRKVTASSLKTYIAATGEALSLADGGLSAIDTIATDDRFIIGDKSVTDVPNKRVDFSTLQTAILAGNATTATLATNVKVTANNTEDASVYLTFVDGDGNQGLEADTGLSYNPSSGKIISTSFQGALSGNATTATALATARTIGGVSFDGSANIDLPGVNTAGNQNTSGNAATATALATARTIGGVSFDGSANIDLPGVNSTGNQNTTGTANLATNVTIVDTGDTTTDVHYLTLVGSATGNLPLKTDGDLSYRADTNTLTIANLAGNASTATILETARTIGGVSFNGSANIDLPGVNTAGTQDTSGNAATATILETTRTIGGVSFNGSANIDLPGVNTAGTQDTSGNAATATALATARTIGGVSFDGSANIDLPGVNTAGNQNTSGTASIATSITATANNSTDETVYITFIDGATGTQGIETDTGLTYNPSSGILTSTNFTGALTGNAATATILATARNIGGVSFDGSANIDLPGVNTSGTQDTSGNAATATALANARTIGGVSFDGSANIDLPGVNSAGNQDTTGNATTATTATLATTVTATANNSTDETVYLTFVDAATGAQGIETDTGLSYNPSSGILTVVQVTGDVTGDLTGNADTATTLATARTIGGVSFDGSANIDLPGVNSAGNQDTSGNAATSTVASSITATANNSTDETTYLTFVDGATGTQGIETDTGLSYNPSSGKVTATSFQGALAGNATTATALATARTIGGVSFDGSANIDLPGVNSTGNQDTTGTASLATKVTVTQNENTNETVYLAFVDGVSGSQGIEADSGLTYNPNTGVLNAEISGNITTATTATNVTVTANNGTNETVYLTFVDGGTGGAEGIETDTGLTYNPSTGVLTTTSVTGNLTGDVTGDVTGNADSATKATTVTVTANNSTNETVYLTFVDGATGTQAIETDTALSYNPNTDTLSVSHISGVALTAPEFANNGYIADSSGNEMLQFLSPGSAVNHLKLTNAATGGAVQLESMGGDNDIDLNLVAKGAGVVKVSDKLRVTGQSNFDQQITVGASGSEANLYVYGELHVDNGVAVFDTASMSLQDPLLFMAKDGAGDADIGFFGKTATITGGSADGNSNVACHTGLFFDSDQRNTGKGLYRLFRAPTGNVSVDNEVTVNRTSGNFVNPAIETCNIKADIKTVTSGTTLDLGNRFLLVSGDHTTTLPTPSATYEGVEFVIRMITGDTPKLSPDATGELIDSSGTAQAIEFSAHGTIRVVCGQNSSGDYKWYQV